MQVLGDKLGPLLFQLPPNFKRDDEVLGGFLELLPPRCRAAFEFRHDSWFDDEVYRLLSGHGRAALVASDRSDADEPPVVATADFGYLRLRRTDYGEADLERVGGAGAGAAVAARRSSSSSTRRPPAGPSWRSVSPRLFEAG